ncbi:MAG: hypothetical protein KDA69_04645 [Planctomycetaceae bacterium]|nr:hypothetical protein [Planctomycetaceae bacterium]
MSKQKAKSVDDLSHLDADIKVQNGRNGVVVRIPAGRLLGSFLLIVGIFSFLFVIGVMELLPWLSKIFAGCLLLSALALIKALFVLATVVVFWMTIYIMTREFIMSRELEANGNGIRLKESCLGMGWTTTYAWDDVQQIAVRRFGYVKQKKRKRPTYAVVLSANGKHKRVVCFLSEDKAKEIVSAIKSVRRR